MSFGDDITEPPDDEPTPRRIKWNVAELDQPAKAKLRASSMAAFCRSIPESDWILLQQLSERTRVGLLQRCLRAMFRARTSQRP